MVLDHIVGHSFAEQEQIGLVLERTEFAELVLAHIGPVVVVEPELARIVPVVVVAVELELAHTEPVVDVVVVLAFAYIAFAEQVLG